MLQFEHSLALLLGFPCGSAGKESTCNAGGLGLEDPLENCMDCSPWGHKE